jgi:hypothetical protein
MAETVIVSPAAMWDSSLARRWAGLDRMMKEQMFVSSM